MIITKQFREQVQTTPGKTFLNQSLLANGDLVLEVGERP